MGPNRYLTSRLTFLRTWTSQPTPDRRRHGHLRAVPLAQHRVTARMRPDPGVVREFVWQPIRELGAPVFAFGKPWFDLLEDRLGLQVVDRLGLAAGPTRRRCPAERCWCSVARTGPVVIAE